MQALPRTKRRKFPSHWPASCAINALNQFPGSQGPIARVESFYSLARGISGTPLRDSYHLGSTIINDYGRPYQNGFNNYSGVSGYASAGRFLLHVRGEFQGDPSATGYSNALAPTLSVSRPNPLHRSYETSLQDVQFG